MPRKAVEIRSIRSERLKTLIDEQGITQAMLSAKIFISQQTISKIINGKANLTEETARKIIEAYPGYSLDYLMGFDQDPKIYDNPLEFEKDWIRCGGGDHPLNNLISVEARIAVALEKMNESGWRVAVDLVESLTKVPAFKNGGTQDEM